MVETSPLPTCQILWEGKKWPAVWKLISLLSIVCLAMLQQDTSTTFFGGETFAQAMMTTLHQNLDQYGHLYMLVCACHLILMWMRFYCN